MAYEFMKSEANKQKAPTPVGSGDWLGSIATNTLLIRRIREIMPADDAEKFLNSPRFSELQAAACSESGCAFMLRKTETGAWDLIINDHAA